MTRLSHRAATELVTALRHDALDTPGADEDAWAARLARLDGGDWLLVDKLARRSTWAQPALLSGTRGWDALDLSEAQLPALVAAAMHVDGRLREQATQALGRSAGPVTSAVVGIRLLDHVPEVVEAARDVAVQGLPGLEVDVVADVLLHGAGRDAARDPWSWLVDTVGLASPEVLERLRRSRFRQARRWGVEQSLSGGLLPPGEVVEIASHDPDQWLRGAAAEHLTDTGTPDLLVPLLSARSVEARLTALTRVREELLDDRTLERLLLDRAPRVREQARWRARRRGVGVADVCRRHLGDAAPGAVAAALDGLAWVGDESDVLAVTDLLLHGSPKVRAAAVRTCAARVPGPTAIEVLVPLLEDPAARVSGAAARVLARAGAPADAATKAWESPVPTVRRAAWRVSRAPGGWQRVASDLRAASDDEPSLRRLGRDGVRGWLRYGAATTWGRPDASDAGAMARHLVGAGLTDDERDRVAFHAGIPFSRRAFDPSPDPTIRHPSAARRRGIGRWFRRR